MDSLITAHWMKILKPLFYVFALSILQSCTTVGTASGLPPGFTYIAEVDSSIIQSPRYFGSENFLGRQVPGYQSSNLVCTTKAAQALSAAQKQFMSKGYSIVVYDAYRPQTAVNEFMRWSLDSLDQEAKNRYYPTIDKKDVFDLGYVAKRSGHSRGSTVDISLIRRGSKLHQVELSERSITDGSKIPFLDDGSVDMGSSFDLFHPVSHHDTVLVSEEYTIRRKMLREVMKANGFKEYAEEWWHYTLADEPFPETYFDFLAE